MKNKGKSSLRSVFLRNLIIGVLAPFILIMLVIAVKTFRGFRADKENDYLTMAQMLADNINEIALKYASVVETAAYDENVTSMDASRAEPFLNQIIADSDNVWSHFLITDNAGIEIAHTEGESHHGTDISDRAYFADPWKKKETVICEPTFSKSTGRRILPIGTPILQNGEQIGVLVGFVRLEYISEVLTQYVITPSNYVFMLNGDGMLAAHPDPEVVLLQNWLTGESDTSVSSANIDNMTKNLKAAVAGMAAGGEGVIWGIGDCIYAYHPVNIGQMSVCIAAPYGEACEIINGIFLMLVIAIVIALVVGVLMAVLMANGISVPFSWIVSQTQGLARGETELAPIGKMVGGYADTKEMKSLQEAMTHLAETLEDMLAQMDEGSRDMLQSVDAIAASIESSNGNANDTSATMQELAATMEEVSATADNMSEFTDSTARTIMEIADQSISGAAFAKESSIRAGESQKTASEGKQSANAMVDGIRATMKESIQNSRQVDEIATLTGDILSIASQTNLLALNASIEAARAGEFGKGFSVVAEEIRALAENSKLTANSIQEISKEVISAVGRLSKDADAMLEFIDVTVLKDYDKFEEIMQYYKQDSMHLEDLLGNFATQAEAVKGNTGTLKDGMRDIAAAVEESAQSIVMAAEASADLVTNLGSIQNEVEDNKRIAGALRQEVDKFR